MPSGVKRLAFLVAFAFAVTVGTALPLPPPAAPAFKAASRAEEHLAMGNPSEATEDPAKGENFLMKKEQYALSYNKKTGTPNWVSWHLNKDWLGDVERENDFRPDGTLPKGFPRFTPRAYFRSGFDKGHLCPSGDRTATPEDNSATFLMTNMIPQAPNNNQKGWERLESYCRGLAKKGKELYIVCGPAGVGGVGSNGFKAALKAEQGTLRVPGKTWKVVLVLPKGVTDPNQVKPSARVIAVIMPNDQTVTKNWAKHRVSAEEVEELTGLTFFSAVPAEVAEELRSHVDDEPIRP